MSKINNFKCKCGHVFFLATFKTTYSTLGKIYKNEKNNERVHCEECGSYEIEYTNIKAGFPSFGAYSSASKEKKREMIKERATNHAKKYHNHLDVK